MGLFDKIFGKKKIENKDEQQSNNHSYKQDWDFYFSNVDDVLGSFCLDLGLSKIAPLTDKPYLVWISVKMNYPREDGLSSNEEFETLNSIEDRLNEFISNNHNAISVGRLTTNGNRDFYFYFGDTALYDKTISEAMVAYPSYSFDFGIKQDENWSSYFDFIYPNPRQFQSIQNRRVVDNLEENGDALTKARPVDHWLYFKTDNDRQNFLNKIEYLKFDIVAKDKDTSIVGTPFTLQLSRVDNVDIDSVNEYVLELWETANECNGEYDGWETSVERE